MSEPVSVVFGEAEESDTDEEGTSYEYHSVGTNNDDTINRVISGAVDRSLPSSQASRPLPLRTLSAQPGVVIQGEASETDSDEDDNDEDHKTKTKRSISDPSSGRHVGLPRLKVELSSRKEHSQHLPTTTATSQNGTTLTPLKGMSKYDTLLHRKLRERNASLQATLYETVADAFLMSAKELVEANQMLGKSQSVIQDVSHNLRVFTTDLKQIEQKLDVINSCDNIPNITIDVKQRETAKT